LYRTFVIEARFGFNRMTWKLWLVDLAKGMLLAALLGLPLTALALWLMRVAGPLWWLWVWAVWVGFQFLMLAIYPIVIAPLFNKFSPLPDGPARERIEALLARCRFAARGLFVMDGSRRSSHGNAFFTGFGRGRRIVFFDTLLARLAPDEVESVLAHELGHFKLHHVRWALVRGLLTTGLLFFALSRVLPMTAFYAAFGLDQTSYGALVVFGAWFSLVSFLLRPIGNALARRHEFAADAFALAHGATAQDLAEALLKLREKSRILPIAHPLYSRVYHSHPPLLERLRAMNAAVLAAGP
jgi:STE24 endopeptidase